nr:MAG TPA: hypothetical protein [Caudoviricetes sp.]
MLSFCRWIEAYMTKVYVSTNERYCFSAERNLRL